MTRPARVDYDTIAHLYDAQPHRSKSADPELLAFMGQSAASDIVAILDIGCGTGNQLVANRSAAPGSLRVGLDRSLGMLRQARSKAPDIAWVQADAALVPFSAQSFDFVSCQHALHHVPDKLGILRAIFRVLRAGGRLVIHGICPQESADWLYYEYFPEAWTIDLADFWPPEDVVTAMEASGFTAVTVERRHLHYEQDLRGWLDVVRRRDTCSQLMAITDTAYAAGLHRLEQDAADRDAAPVRPDHLCLVTIRGKKPIGFPEPSPE
jgi:ubiquinone/menaquinone biosynthesis C-methylase UbiE